MSASDRLIIPFSADGSSKRAVRAVLALLYGDTRVQGAEQSEFYLNSQKFRMSAPKIYNYVGNRLTQMNLAAANAFKTVVDETSYASGAPPSMKIGFSVLATWRRISLCDTSVRGWRLLEGR